jgi:microcystin-dependent protein
MSLPVGTVVGMIGQDPSSPPPGWLYCDGSLFEGQRYPQLAKILGNNTLPNLVGLSLIGASNGAPYPPSNKGNTGGTHQNADGTYGSETHTLTVEQMPSHQHFGYGSSNGEWPLGVHGDDRPGAHTEYKYGNYYYGTMFAGGGPENTDQGVANFGFPLLQHSYAIYFFICASSDTADEEH